MAQRYTDPNDPYGLGGTFDDETTIDPNMAGGGNPITPLPGSVSLPQTVPGTTTGAGQAGTAGNYKGKPVDPKVAALVADFIKSHGLTANQSDPSSLHQIADYLKSQGINAQVAFTDQNGHTGGLNIDGNEYQLIDGSNNWTTLQPWQDNGGADGDWFDQNLGAPEPYQTLARPDYLQGEYKPPTWDENFQAPDAAALYNDPGYQGRLDAARKGFERSAAAKGSILSGGSQVALGRQQQDLASQEYGQLFGRAYDTYQQRYGQFRDRLAASAGARGLNESSYQNDVSNYANQYGKRYQTWRDAVNDQFRLGELGFNATTAGGSA